jgi:hypothetical protein
VLTDLAVPFVDTRASALSWWLGDDAPPPLATLVLRGRSGALELRLLGASHHVVATAGAARCPEVVACGGRRSPLPPSHEGRLGDGRYRFTSTTTSYDDAGLARAARALRRRYEGAPDALLGVFPGSPHALTVLTGRRHAAAGRGRAGTSTRVPASRPHPQPAGQPMSRGSKRLLAVVLVLAGLAGIVALDQRGGVREHVLATYDVVEQDGRSYRLARPTRSPRPRPTSAAPGRRPRRWWTRAAPSCATPTTSSASPRRRRRLDRCTSTTRTAATTAGSPTSSGFWGVGGSGGPIGGTRGGGPGAGK